MGSIMDSRYWVCPHCCRQFDWESDDPRKQPDSHDTKKCEKAEQRKRGGN